MGVCGFGAICWSDFDWQSFSTLVTGLAAVIAAYYVSQKQADILSRQVELEEANLRAALFERRLHTYDATVDFVLHIASIKEVDPKAENRIERFCQKMRESQFLFSDPKVYQALLGFWEKGNTARIDRAMSISDYQDGVSGDNERIRRLMEYPRWSLQTLETLADLFRSDLSIIKDKSPLQ